MTSPRLFRSAALVSVGTLFSRILGLLREILMAMAFGTELIASAFFLAFSIPNLFRRLFGEGALSAAFVPTYVAVRDGQSAQEGWALTHAILVRLTIFLSGVTAIGVLACRVALPFVSGPKLHYVFSFLSILLPYAIGICLAAITMGVLYSHRKYLVPAFSPCILNLSMIAALIATMAWPEFRMEDKATWLAWAVLLAGGLQFAVQLPGMRQLGFRWRRPSNDVREATKPQVKKVLLLMGPAAIGAAVTQVNVLLDRVLALWVADYGTSALVYAERWIYLPLGLFATALGSVLLPELSMLVQKKDKRALAATVEDGFGLIGFLLIPSALGLGVLAEPLIRVMFMRGEFTQDSLVWTTRALWCYAPGLWLFGCLKVVLPFFFANKDTRTPVRVGVIAVGANIALNILLILLLPDGWKHAGMAVGTVLSAALQLSVLSWMLHRRFVKLNWRKVIAGQLRSLGVTLPMIAWALWVFHALPASVPELGRLLGAVGSTAAGYLVICTALRFPEPRSLFRK